VLLDLVQDNFQSVGCFRRNHDLGMAYIRACFADLDIDYPILPAVPQYQIQHLGQSQRIDNVSVQVDRFRLHPLLLLITPESSNARLAKITEPGSNPVPDYDILAVV
jgi:hypothetical protein